MQEAEVFSWSHQHLLEVLTAGPKPILSKPNIIKAFKRVKRSDFLHRIHEGEHFADKDVEFSEGNVVFKPSLYASILNELDVEEQNNYLVVGAGSGYLCALLGYAVGSEGEVLGLDISKTFCEIAIGNIAKYPEIQKTTKVLFRDGADGLVSEAPYDGIVFTVKPKKVTEELKRQLKVGGKLIYPRTDGRLEVVSRDEVNVFNYKDIDVYIFEDIQEELKG